MTSVNVSAAPTKIILIGEHTVLYGSAAICVPVPYQTIVRILPNTRKGIIINMASQRYTAMMEEHVNRVCDLLEAPETPLSVSIELTVPPGIGFGVSASVALAMVRALAGFFEISLPVSRLFEIVNELEKVNHGNPSGVDHTTIILNTPIICEKTAQGMTFTEAPDLYVPELFSQCYLIHTGIPHESTKEMVARVAALDQKTPAVLLSIATQINAHVRELQAVLRAKNSEACMRILNAAGLLLEQLGVVSSDVLAFSATVRALGGAAKISGAGGITGGSGILLVGGLEKEAVDQLCAQYGYELIPWMPLV